VLLLLSPIVPILLLLIHHRVVRDDRHRLAGGNFLVAWQFFRPEQLVFR
jgi:hypothetical protein